MDEIEKTCVLGRETETNKPVKVLHVAVREKYYP